MKVPEDQIESIIRENLYTHGYPYKGTVCYLNEDISDWICVHFTPKVFTPIREDFIRAEDDLNKCVIQFNLALKLTHESHKTTFLRLGICPVCDKIYVKKVVEEIL